jgi:hypothetical protein
MTAETIPLLNFDRSSNYFIPLESLIGSWLSAATSVCLEMGRLGEEGAAVLRPYKEKCSWQKRLGHFHFRQKAISRS